MLDHTFVHTGFIHAAQRIGHRTLGVVGRLGNGRQVLQRTPGQRVRE